MTGVTTKKVRPYGLWDSKIPIASIFDQPSTPMYPFHHGDDLYWLQALPQQGGRIVLMRQGPEHEECLTPEGFNIRSKVHEYGGRCFCLCGDAIVFNNFSDGGLYLQRLNSDAAPRLVCPLNKSCVGFADLVFLEPFNTLVAVAEQTRKGQDNENLLIAVNIGDPAAGPYVLVSGSDFYASPVFDLRNQLAWFEWDHPNMPWDQSRLYVAELRLDTSRLTLHGFTAVVDQPHQSVCQPGFLEDGSLIFASDDNANNWWNLYLWNAGTISKLAEEPVEYGEAHWVFGQRRWCQTDSGTLIAIATSHNCDQLVEIDVGATDTPKSLYQSASISHLDFDGERILMVVTPVHQPGSIMQFELQPAAITGIGPQPESIASDGYSLVEPINYPTRDGEKCWAYFYPPYNPDFVASTGTLPPLLVMVHGGPTSRTNTAYHPLRQYFTSLGFAILDINHRGSTGYGRAYRQRLLGGWGEVDAMDIADGIEYLISTGRVDGNAIFIRGGSAGGYAVLRALTRYATLFAGGACYYGIGNLITLSEITHKFEGRYTDQLVGQVFDPETAMKPGSLYIERSPIFEIEQLQAPLILFQGLLDKVVPPEVSREVVSALKSRGIHYAYTEYEGEGHGFRQTETRIDSLEKEANFFRSIINQNSI